MDIKQQVSEIFPVDSRVKVDGQYNGLVESIGDNGEIVVKYNDKQETFHLFDRLQIVNKPFEIMRICPEYDDVTKANIEDIKKIITDDGGFIKNEEAWGKKKLAYKINVYDEGFYSLITVNTTDETIKKVNQYCANNGDNIIRYMIIRKGV